MTTVTDPARELADICMRLTDGVSTKGDDFLAAKFQVPVWSTQFFQIIFCISKRADDLVDILQQLDIDNDYRIEFASHIDQIKQAFSPNGLQNAWSHSVINFISPSNVNSVKALSGLVRPFISFPRLNEDEVVEVLGLVEELLDWLKEHQLAERDFVRAALIEGLEQFDFRLRRINWLGWGYSLNSLRDVISAYLALERGTLDIDSAPDAGAVLKKTAGCIKAIFGKIGTVRETAGDVAFMILAYEQIVSIAQGTTPVAGLLTFAGS